MAFMMVSTISWFGVLALAALLYVIVRGLANHRTRPYLIWLAVLPGLLVLFYAVSRQPTVRVQERPSFGELARLLPRTATTSRVEPDVSESASAPTPSRTSIAAETKRPKMTLIAALRQAVVRSLNTRTVAPTAEAPEKPAGTGRTDVSARSQPPDWVNAAPRMEDNCYTMSVHTDPFTTELECRRDLSRVLQAAVAEYAELSLGPEAVAVRLSDDDLKQLVHGEPWPEHRFMEIGTSGQDMVALHAQVAFDARAQQRIKSEAQRLVVNRRVQGAAVVFGGVLTFLALAWGGLKLATRRSTR